MGIFSKTTPAKIQSSLTPQTPEILDNVNKKVVDDLKQTIQKGSRISIAAASFSIYAFEALKKELNQ